jgi:hypothetical protein
MYQQSGSDPTAQPQVRMTLFDILMVSILTLGIGAPIVTLGYVSLMDLLNLGSKPRTISGLHVSLKPPHYCILTAEQPTVVDTERLLILCSESQTPPQ